MPQAAFSPNQIAAHVKSGQTLLWCPIREGSGTSIVDTVGGVTITDAGALWTVPNACTLDKGTAGAPDAGSVIFSIPMSFALCWAFRYNTAASSGSFYIGTGGTTADKIGLTATTCTIDTKDDAAINTSTLGNPTNDLDYFHAAVGDATAQTLTMYRSVAGAAFTSDSVDISSIAARFPLTTDNVIQLGFNGLEPDVYAALLHIWPGALPSTFAADLLWAANQWIVGNSAIPVNWLR